MRTSGRDENAASNARLMTVYSERPCLPASSFKRAISSEEIVLKRQFQPIRPVCAPLSAHSDSPLDYGDNQLAEPRYSGLDGVQQQ